MVWFGSCVTRNTQWRSDCCFKPTLTRALIDNQLTRYYIFILVTTRPLTNVLINNTEFNSYTIPTWNKMLLTSSRIFQHYISILVFRIWILEIWITLNQYVRYSRLLCHSSILNPLYYMINWWWKNVCDIYNTCLGRFINNF